MHGESSAYAFPADVGAVAEEPRLAVHLRAAAARPSPGPIRPVLPPPSLDPPPLLEIETEERKTYAQVAVTRTEAPRPPGQQTDDHVPEVHFLALYLQAYLDVAGEMYRMSWDAELPGPGPLERTVRDFRRLFPALAVPALLAQHLGSRRSGHDGRERENLAIWAGQLLGPVGRICPPFAAPQAGPWTDDVVARLEVDEDATVVGGSEASISFPQRPDELGRSHFGSRVVLGLLTTPASSRLTAVRRVPVSDTADFCIRRLKDFTRFLDNHPHLLNYSRFLQHEKVWYLARNVCDYNLDTFLARLRSHPGADVEAETRPLMFQMLRGLAFLHNKVPALFHGNLKPDNCLIDSRRILRLTDFGFGKLCTLRQSSTGALRDESSGRLHPITWKPPEFYAVEKSYSDASDVFAAGLLGAYALSSGRRHPFLPDPPAVCRPPELAGRLLRVRPRLDGASLEAQQLLAAMLRVEQTTRLSAAAALAHPFFWGRDRRLAFLLAIAALLCNGLGDPAFAAELVDGDAERETTAVLLERLRLGFRDSGDVGPTRLLGAFPGLFLQVYALVARNPELCRLEGIARFLLPPSS